jgi:hypothetical protein
MLCNMFPLENRDPDFRAEALENVATVKFVVHEIQH